MPRHAALIPLILILATVLPAQDSGFPHFATKEGMDFHRRYLQAVGCMNSGDQAAALARFTELCAVKLAPEPLGEVTFEVESSYYNAACAAALLGDPDRALLALDQAIACGYDDAKHMAKDSDLDSLRALPRYQALEKLARSRAGRRTEVGEVLVLPHDDTLALHIPATATCPARVLALDCSRSQRQQLEALMKQHKPVAITGAGGTESRSFTFAVAAFAAAPAAKPSP
jgi:hypothetical protein